MQPNSTLINGNIDDAINALAERSVALQYYAPRLPQQALEKTAFLQDAGKHSTALHKGLMGAGIGGVLGLGSSLFKDKEDRQPINSAITGALAGGVIGTGIGMAHNNAPKPAKAKAGPHFDQGEFELNPGGPRYRWNKPLPTEQAKRVAELQSKSEDNVVSKGLEGTGKLIYDAATSPAAAVQATALGGLGLAKNQVGDGTNPGWLNKIISPGKQEAVVSRNPRHLRTGISKLTADGDLLESFGLTDRKDELRELLDNDKKLKALAKKAPGYSAWSNALNPKPRLHEIDGLLSKLKELGVTAEMGETWTKKNPGAIPQVRQSLLGSLSGGRLSPEHIVAGTTSSKIRRAGKYGIPLAGLAALTHMLSSYRTQSNAKRDLYKIISENAKPVE